MDRQRAATTNALVRDFMKIRQHEYLILSIIRPVNATRTYVLELCRRCVGTIFAATSGGRNLGERRQASCVLEAEKLVEMFRETRGLFVTSPVWKV